MLNFNIKLIKFCIDTLVVEGKEGSRREGKEGEEGRYREHGTREVMKGGMERREGGRQEEKSMDGEREGMR